LCQILNKINILYINIKIWSRYLWHFFLEICRRGFYNKNTRCGQTMFFRYRVNLEWMLIAQWIHVKIEKHDKKISIYSSCCYLERNACFMIRIEVIHNVEEKTFIYKKNSIVFHSSIKEGYLEQTVLNNIRLLVWLQYSEKHRRVVRYRSDNNICDSLWSPVKLSVTRSANRAPFSWHYVLSRLSCGIFEIIYITCNTHSERTVLLKYLKN